MLKPRVKQSATIKSRISMRKLTHICRLLQYLADKSVEQIRVG